MFFNWTRLFFALVLGTIPTALPACYLLYVSPLFKYYKKYRILDWIDRIFYHCLSKSLNLWHNIIGIKVYQLGDDVSIYINEPAITISNHVNSLDSVIYFELIHNYFKRVHYYTRIEDRYPWLTKSHTLRGHYIEKPDDMDKSKSYAQNLKQNFFPLYHWCAIYPENGLPKNVRTKSAAYAKANNIPLFKHLSVPYVSGFQTALNTLASNNAEDLHQVKWVVDHTLIYSNDKMGVENLFRGIISDSAVYIYTKVYEARKIPRDTENVKKWIFDRFREKDEILAKFQATRELPAKPKRYFPITFTFTVYFTLYVYISYNFIFCPLLHMALNIIN